MASRWRHCADLIGPGIKPQTSRTESVRLVTELTAEVYAENSVVHMIAGRAVCRALRTHFLTESALMTLLMTLIVDEGIVDANIFTVVLNTFSESPIKIKWTLAADVFSKLTEAVADTKRLLALKSRTARISYIWIMWQ